MSASKRRRARALRPVAVKGGAADVYIEGVIGADVSAADVREQIASAKGATELRVHINSEGGSVTEGMAIYSALRSFSGRKVGVVEGLAASMASVVLMACDERIVSKGAFVMVHNPSGGVAGEAKDMRSTAELLDKIRAEMLDIYESRTGAARSDIESWVDAETYFTADEAVAAGIADSVGDGATAHIKLDAVARLNPAKIPEALRALAQKESKMTAEEEKEMRAKLKALEEENARLKAEAEDDSDGEEEESAEDDKDGDKDARAEDDEKSDDDKEARALARDVKRLTGAKNFGEARGRLVAMSHKAGASARDSRAAAVSKLVAEGKLVPSLKKWALGCSDDAFAGYVAGVADIQVAPVGQKHAEPAAGAGAADTREPSGDEAKLARMFGLSTDDAIKARSAKFRIGLNKEDN